MLRVFGGILRGDSSCLISTPYTYLGGLEVAELTEEDMPMV